MLIHQMSKKLDNFCSKFNCLGNSDESPIIEIIQFCLKIYDLWRDPHLWDWCMGGLVKG